MTVIDKTERHQIRELPIETDWNISAVARELNIARTTLYRKMKKYHLKEQRMVE
ncbi:helix-turn-helix domain-containing protein [Mesobacillus maritimus]|uniref:helix-turn-helix domain-containing protein n=1 Tax=Mesobacillus maritimus TaxID=1643336 RepID=UPI00384B58AA